MVLLKESTSLFFVSNEISAVNRRGSWAGHVETQTMQTADFADRAD